jgi:PLP dependent protein
MKTEIDDALLEELTAQVANGLRIVRATVESCGVDPLQLTIIAVTKGWGPEAPLAALANGLCWFGENYADELVEKALAVREFLHESSLRFPKILHVGLKPRWTFQGKLQSNKINRLKDFVELWQTVDSIDRARALGSRVPGAQALIQVVLDNSGSRGGCHPEQVPELLAVCRETGLEVRGLMGVGPDVSLHGAAAVHEAFSQLGTLARDHDLSGLSMGMSDDYPVALACGATHLRLGSVLFGART